MPTFPALPKPNSVEPPSLFDPALEVRFDGGAIATRSKYTAARQSFRLFFTTDLDDWYIINDFVHDVRGRGLTFDWTFPDPHTVTDATAATPIAITTTASHGLRTGQTVIVAGVNAEANGQRVVTRTGATTVTLDGTVGVSPASQGSIGLYFPKMRLVLPAGEWPAPRKLTGPVRDNIAYLQYALTVEEDF